MQKFAKIGSFSKVAKFVNEYPELNPAFPDRFEGRIVYEGTVKLHGTNAEMSVIDGKVVPQSRNRLLGDGEDNCGFAAWVKEREGELYLTLRDAGLDDGTTIYGEFIGPGINRGSAVCKLPNKQLVVFASRGRDGRYTRRHSRISQDEELGLHHVFQAETWTASVDFYSDDSRDVFSRLVDELTMKVEEQCPWGKLFGVEGVGEGIVWTPAGEHYGLEELFIKTKGAQHRVAQRRAAAVSDPEILDGAREAVAFTCTERRMEQGIEVLREMGKPIEMTSLGDYLKWIGNDIREECEPELKESGISWKQVSREITRRAKEYFLLAMERECEDS